MQNILPKRPAAIDKASWRQNEEERTVNISSRKISKLIIGT